MPDSEPRLDKDLLICAISNNAMRDAEEMFGEMRPSTDEEARDYDNMLKSLSQPLGVSIFDQHVAKEDDNGC